MHSTRALELTQLKGMQSLLMYLVTPVLPAMTCQNTAVKRAYGVWFKYDKKKSIEL